MKKKIFTIITGLLIAATVSVTAQHSYFKVGLGYNFPTMQQPMGMTNYEITGTIWSYQESIAKQSLHKGITPMLSFGHMFNENVGFELGVDYLLGIRNKARQGINIGGVSAFNELSSTAKSMNLYPSLRLAVPLGKTVSLYSRTGIIIPVLSRVVEKLHTNGYDSLGTARDVKVTKETKSKFAIGFTGALGIDFKLSSKVSFFTECNIQLLNLWAKSDKITLIELNGKDQLKGLNRVAVETDYLKALGHIYNTGQRPDRPAEALTYQYPFHSLGLNLGLSFRL